MGSRSPWSPDNLNSATGISVASAPPSKGALVPALAPRLLGHGRDHAIDGLEQLVRPAWLVEDAVLSDLYQKL